MSHIVSVFPKTRKEYRFPKDMNEEGVERIKRKTFRFENKKDSTAKSGRLEKYYYHETKIVQQIAVREKVEREKEKLNNENVIVTKTTDDLQEFARICKKSFMKEFFKNKYPEKHLLEGLSGLFFLQNKKIKMRGIFSLNQCYN